MFTKDHLEKYLLEDLVSEILEYLSGTREYWRGELQKHFPSLLATVEKRKQSRLIRIMAINYNVLRIMSGSAGLGYIT